MGSEKTIVGDLINFRGLAYAPLNENSVIYLFVTPLVRWRFRYSRRI